jgi:hypothetical protein
MTDSSRLSWQKVVATVAAAAGGAAWVSAIGSAVMGLRLENARMPVESTVALMSSEHRFTIGAGALAAPLFVGLVGAISDWVLISALGMRRTAPKTWGEARTSSGWKYVERPALAMVTTVVGAGLGLVVLQPLLLWQYLAQSAAILIVVPIVFWRVERAKAAGKYRGPDERLVVFLVILFISGLIALLGEHFRSPPKFDEATITVKAGPPAIGAYVTTTANAIVLITRSADGCPTIDAVPRDQAVRIRVGPAKLEVQASERCSQDAPAL